MFRNCRIWPWSSRTWRLRSGNFAVNSLRASAIVTALQSTLGWPSVKRRKAVGISMITGMFLTLSPFRHLLQTGILNNCLSFMGCKYAATGGELRVHERFEGFNFRRNGFAERIFADDGVGGLQAVAGDAHDGRFIPRNATLIDQLFRDA